MHLAMYQSTSPPSRGGLLGAEGAGTPLEEQLNMAVWVDALVCWEGPAPAPQTE